MVKLQQMSPSYVIIDSYRGKTLKFLEDFGLSAVDPDLFRKVFEGRTDLFASAKLHGLVTANNVGKSGCYQQILLLQSQLLAAEKLQHARRMSFHSA